MKNKLSILCAAAILSGLFVHADTVYFNYGTSLSGKLQEFNKERLVILLDGEENKRVVIDPATVQKIDLDYESRLNSLKADDYLGHYELGKWCMQLIEQDPQMLSLAINRFLYCCGKSGVPADAYLFLGRLFEKTVPPSLSDALDYYRKYLAEDPENQETKDAIARLEKLLTNKPAPAATGTTSQNVEGYEKNRWYTESWGNQASSRTVTDKGNSNNQLLEITIRTKDKDKTALRMPVERSLKDMESISFDAYNPNNFSINVKIALIGGAEGAWCEQIPEITLPAKSWSKDIQVNLDRNYWKIYVRGKQKALSALPELNPVRNLLLLVMPTKSTATLYLDSLRFNEKK